MKKFLITAILVLMTATLGAAIPTQTAFLAELSAGLHQRGWTDVEIDSFMAQAHQQDWSDALQADPAVIAFALHYGIKEQGAPVLPESAVFQAQVALEFARETASLQRLGYQGQTIAQAGARGIKDVVDDLAKQKLSGSDPLFGQYIKSMVHANVAAKLASQSQRGGPGQANQNNNRAQPGMFGPPGQGNGNKREAPPAPGR